MPRRVLRIISWPIVSHVFRRVHVWLLLPVGLDVRDDVHGGYLPYGILLRVWYKGSEPVPSRVLRIISWPNVTDLFSCVHVGLEYYGSSIGQTSPTCSGACTSGYYCPPGSTSATMYTAATCPIGFYCASGTMEANPCLAGYFGSSIGQTSPTCSGACTLGYHCPPGSMSATMYSTAACPIGFYCAPGTTLNRNHK